MSAWLLPESIADILPYEARCIEEMRRRLLDRFRCYGYELVMPPLLEYVESLLTGTGHALGLKTFKLVDQLSGRTLGLRADITPQVARIDAHLLNRPGVTRLCYCGPVVHTLPAGLNTTREPLQCGAELYGYAGVEADFEIVCLAIDALQLGQVDALRLDICHAGLLDALLSEDGLGVSLSNELSMQLHGWLAAKDGAALAAALSAIPASAAKDGLLALTSLYGPALGDHGVLAQAERLLPDTPRVRLALDELARLAHEVSLAYPDVPVLVDLADLHGYEYHTGLMFSIYAQRNTNALVRGGRYDEVGKVFGRARPATGFSVDLRELVRYALPNSAHTAAIRAPWSPDPALARAIRGLREQGEVVVQSLPGAEPEGQEFKCDRELSLSSSTWYVQPIKSLT
ncbi:MAG: ATP phosphoribosyltransferase regulatory subunit [Burkholderiaceae bacterium]